jgi:Mce-associated membrane protein
MEGSSGQRHPILTPVRIRSMSSRRTETTPDAETTSDAGTASSTEPGASTTGSAGSTATGSAGPTAVNSASGAAASTRPRAKRRTEGARKPGAGTALAERDVERPRAAAAPEAAVPAAESAAAPVEDRPTAEVPSAAQDVPQGAVDEPAEDEATTPAPRPVRKIETAAAAEGDLAAPADPADRKRLRLLFGLAGAAVLLVAASVVVGVGAFTARSSGPLANQAFVDSAATAELVGQVTNAMTTVYSYDYTTLSANEAAANGVITGKFATEFPRVFAPVKQLAPQEQAVLKSTVPAAGVIMLQGDRARLLMMVDQTGTRGAAKEPTGATARLVVDAQKVDGRWKIAEVTPE